MAEIYQLPDNGGNAGMGGVPFSIPLGGNGGGSIEEAVRILLGVNTGMCVSRSDIRMSLVFIGSTSSEEQFWDTVVHELYHASCALCDYYDVAHDSEGFAWTIGYLVRKAVGLLAPPCK